MRRSLARSRGPVLGLVAIGFLAGCVTAQSREVSPLPQIGYLTKQGSLLYVLDKLEGRKLSVYTFPAGSAQKRILMPTDGWAYVCSDDSGNVYAPTADVIFKYAHGGRRPVAYLQDKGALGGECAADAKTGNLLVTGGANDCKAEIYLHTKGNPTCIKAIETIIEYPTYDSDGNLFFNYGTGNNFLGELPAGGSKIVKIALDHAISNYYDLQWDGHDIAIQTKLPGTEDEPVAIERVHVVGTKGTVAKAIRFTGWTNHTENFWISGSLIVAPLSYTELGIWNYPQGGKAVSSVAVPHFWSWTVSVPRN